MKTSINYHELEKFLEFWKDKVDMIGVQEFVTPTKIENPSLASRTKEKKILNAHFHLSNL